MRILRLLPIAVLLIALAFPLMPAVPAYAATETLRPNAAGDVTQLVKSGSGGANWDRVDEAVADEDTTYVRAYQTYSYDLYNLPVSSGSGTINFIKVYIRCKNNVDTGSPSRYAKIKTGGTEYNGTSAALTTSYVTSNHQWDTNPKTGVAWTWDDIDALQIGVYLNPGTTDYATAYCTQVYVEVDYTAVGPPVVTSQAATNVEETTATFNGNITSASPACDYRGFVWGTTSKTDPGDVAPADSGYDTFWIQSGSYGTGAFSRDITDLTPGTTWYYRACAHNTYGWDYSDTQQTVYTKPGDPSNLVATAVSSSQIDLTWTAGAGAEKTMVRGKQGSYPTGVTDGYQVYFGTGTSASDTGLSQGTTYYYRAWAWDTNSGYSDGYSQASATTLIGERHLALWIQYEHDTTFHDLSGYDNDATPNFRTTSSDPDVSATFQNFRPIKEAVCAAGITEETPEMLTETPEMPSEFYTEGEVIHLPGAALVNSLLDAGGIPYDLFWIPFCFGLAAVAVVLSYYFLKSMMFVAIIGGVIIMFFALTGAIPLWTLLIYVIITAGVLVSERTFGW